MKQNRMVSFGIIMICILVCSCTSYIYVDRIIPPAFDTSNIHRIAIIEFKNYSQRMEAGQVLTGKMVQRFHNSASFEVVERQELDTILREHSLNLSGAINESQVVEIGNLAGVDAFIFGSVTYYFGEASSPYSVSNSTITATMVDVSAAVTVDIKIVSVETAQTLWSSQASKTFNGSGYTSYRINDDASPLSAIAAAMTNPVKPPSVQSCIDYVAEVAANELFYPFVSHKVQVRVPKPKK